MVHDLSDVHWGGQQDVHRALHTCVNLLLLGIIGLHTCAAHCGLHHPEICVRWMHPCACLFSSCGCRWVMDVSVYCSLQISQPFIHPKHSANQPLPQSICEPLYCSTPIDTHCHIPDSEWHTHTHYHIPDSVPVPCLMGPRLHSSSWGDWIHLCCAVTTLCQLIHADWHSVFIGVWYSFCNW